MIMLRYLYKQFADGKKKVKVKTTLTVLNIIIHTVYYPHRDINNSRTMEPSNLESVLTRTASCIFVKFSRCFVV